EAVVAGSGAKLTASATLAGSCSATGTLTFTLKGPGGTTVDTETVTVSGNATYQAPGFAPSTPGTYQWVATYAGDRSNASAAPTLGAAPEPAQAVPTLTVAAATTAVISAQTLLTASATLAGSNAATGFIMLTLTGPAGDIVYASPSYVVNGNGTYSLGA